MDPLQVAVLSSLISAGVTVLLTRALEPWRASLHSRHWVAQERWKLKADIYSKLLAGLDEQARIMNAWDLEEWRDQELERDAARSSKPIKLEDLDETPLTPAGPEDGAPSGDAKRLMELTQEQHRLRSIADLWLDTAARKALDDMEREIAKAYPEGQGAAHPHGQAASAVEEARRLLQHAAERDLQLRV